ncbi:protein kinase domain-containing protein [Paenibacillus beijingensis]|uniref:Serine/threonine protein kinase n=1 Tax=Paenibacillus beijingensis TaxID=1126833 RepID=A0A0D5NHT5_9BACL|nr:serine/threonine protein kinase [Paenibacillus beijingensis]AJY74949.1 serine/threonine protein kinase [Paenibacillus beijingensis]
MTTSFKLVLERGAVVTGKWKQRRYRVDRLLGEGANGKVFLVSRDRSWYALKVGSSAVDLQSEVNVLQSLAGQQLRRRDAGEPFLIDVDDLQARDGREYPFYVMKYVKGVKLSDYLRAERREWFPVVGCNLLKRLWELHRAGWAFGDLKMENVLVADYGRVELVDYGGVTEFGKGVRQFTEIYDRGFWNAGSRSADAAYDLFSFAVLCVQLHEGRRLQQLSAAQLPQTRSPEELLKLVQANPTLKPFSGWISRAIAGGFRDTGEAVSAWQAVMHRIGTYHNSQPAPRWMKGLFVACALALGATVYWIARTGL